MHLEEGVGGEEMAMLGNESLPLTESLLENLRDRFPLHRFIYKHVRLRESRLLAPTDHSTEGEYSHPSLYPFLMSVHKILATRT